MGCIAGVVRAGIVASAVVLCVSLCACRADERQIPDAPDAGDWRAAVLPGGGVTLVGAGDIGDCSSHAPYATAALLADIPGLVFTLGDNAYPQGTIDDFLDCFDRNWGRHRGRMAPTVGNHEYHVPNAGAYFAYFGAAAGEPFLGRYSFEAGSWHVISLNTNCISNEGLDDIDIDQVDESIGGCGVGGEQAEWLRADLAAHPSACTLVMMHHPRFSSGHHGNHPDLAPLWVLLVEHGVDVVLSGHEHNYERFAPQRADGTRDDARGIREFVVGTGGAELRPFTEPRLRNTEVRQDRTHGVLKLSLHADAYDWEFVAVPGVPAFSDEGHGTCH